MASVIFKHTDPFDRNNINRYGLCDIVKKASDSVSIYDGLNGRVSNRHPHPTTTKATWAARSTFNTHAPSAQAVSHPRQDIENHTYKQTAVTIIKACDSDSDEFELMNYTKKHPSPYTGSPNRSSRHSRDLSRRSHFTSSSRESRNSSSRNSMLSMPSSVSLGTPSSVSKGDPSRLFRISTASSRVLNNGRSSRRLAFTEHNSTSAHSSGSGRARAPTRHSKRSLRVSSNQVSAIATRPETPEAKKMIIGVLANAIFNHNADAGTPVLRNPRINKNLNDYLFGTKQEQAKAEENLKRYAKIFDTNPKIFEKKYKKELLEVISVLEELHIESFSEHISANAKVLAEKLVQKLNKKGPSFGAKLCDMLKTGSKEISIGIIVTLVVTIFLAAL